MAAPPGARYYTYQDEKILLEPLESRITVGMREGVSPALRKSLTMQESLTLPSGTLEVTAQPAGKGVHIIRLGREGVLSGSSLQSGPARGPSGLPMVKAPLILPGQAPATAPQARTPSQEGGMAESLQPEEMRARRKEALDYYRSQGSVEWAYFAQRDPATGNVLYLTPRILIRADETADESRDAAALRKSLPASVRLVRPLPFTENQFLLELTNPDSDHPLDVAAALEEEYPWIIWAHPDFIQQWRRSFSPNDSLYNNQWHHNNTGQGGGSPGADSRLEGAWGTVTGDGSVVIAIIDDGVQTDHPDLVDRIFVNPGEIPGNGIDDDGNGLIDDVNGWDFAENDNDPNGWDANSFHGTAVAGVAAAAGDNNIGVSGACWNCTILPVRIFDDFGYAYDDKIVSALNYAGEMADVLNNSWGGGSPTPALDAAIESVHSMGKPLIFASGNYGSGYITFILSGFTAGTYVFEWEYSKDASGSKGSDTMWLDNVIFPGSSSTEDFEGCSADPGTMPGWDSYGDSGWTVTADESRASSGWGGNCSAKAGGITHNQRTVLRVEKTVGAGDLVFDFWVSSEDKGIGYLADNYCKDGFRFYVNGMAQPFYPWFICGTYSNQGVPLNFGSIIYPASHAKTIAVGASSDYDHRSSYSQWGSRLDVLAPSGGGASGITTTDLTGSDPSPPFDSKGYSSGSYYSGFSGTSSSTPLVSGIVGLLLTQDSITNGSITLSPEAIRTALHAASRPAGCQGGSLPDPQYGYGVLDADALIHGTTPTATPATCNTLGVAALDFTYVKSNSSTSSSSSSGGCLITWMTEDYLADAQLDPLRSLRDFIAEQGAWGKALVRSYYSLSGRLIAWLESLQNAKFHPLLAASI